MQGTPYPQDSGKTHLPVVSSSYQLVCARCPRPCTEPRMPNQSLPLPTWAHCAAGYTHSTGKLRKSEVPLLHLLSPSAQSQSKCLNPVQPYFCPCPSLWGSSLIFLTCRLQSTLPATNSLLWHLSPYLPAPGGDGVFLSGSCRPVAATVLCWHWSHLLGLHSSFRDYDLLSRTIIPRALPIYPFLHSEWFMSTTWP
jgi:hypothetical protein